MFYRTPPNDPSSYELLYDYISTFPHKVLIVDVGVAGLKSLVETWTQELGARNWSNDRLLTDLIVLRIFDKTKEWHQYVDYVFLNYIKAEEHRHELKTDNYTHHIYMQHDSNLSDIKKLQETSKKLYDNNQPVLLFKMLQKSPQDIPTEMVLYHNALYELTNDKLMSNNPLDDFICILKRIEVEYENTSC